MNDADRQLLERIDGELRDALTVTPSSGFLPRVRERIAEEPESGGFRVWRWLVPAAAVAGAAILAVRVMDTPAPPDVLPGFSRAGIATLKPATTPARPLVWPSRVARKTTRAPEVLVPETDRIAFERFVVALSKGRIDEAAVDAALSRRLEDIAIAPIEIKPLTSEP
jgi:hypothetical protein